MMTPRAAAIPLSLGFLAMAFAWEATGAAAENPTQDRLSARSGSVDLWLQTPDDWPPDGRQTLFHVGETSHSHVTLFFHKGALRAVYKGDVDHYSSIDLRESTRWAPGSRHRVQFSWRGEGETVEFFLRVDDELVRIQSGKTVESWPESFFLGARGPEADPWQGSIEVVGISPEPLDLPEMAPGRRVIEVRADREAGLCHNFWSTHNFTSQDQFTQPDMRERIRRPRPFMRYVNCVRLIGGRSDGKNRWFLGVGPDGEIETDFSGLIDCLRGIQDWGYTPRIVLDNVPTAMSDVPEMHTYGNTYPPKDYDLYHRYIQSLVEALVEAFGRDVVSQWRFRVMTEPDLYPGHWAGTKEEYLKLYDYAVDAVTRVIPDADIGPGNVLNPFGRAERGTWGLDIIDHAATGNNHFTGAVGTRLRYISCSWYGRVGNPIDTFEKAIGAMRERLEAHPQFQGLPVEVAEFSVLNDERGRRYMGAEGSEWSASFLAAIADRAWQLNVARIHMWAVSGPNGTPIPYTRVLGMLEQMAGGRRLAVETRGDPELSSANCSATACRKDGRLYVLLYNHRPARTPEIPEHVTLRLHDSRMKAGQPWTISEWQVDQGHGVFIRAFEEDCRAAGLEPAPESGLFTANVAMRFGPKGAELFRDNQEKYTEMSALHQARNAEPLPLDNGSATIEFDMPGHSVRLLELSPPN
jgi:xylan 1,4-beta-xylosidase